MMHLKFLPKSFIIIFAMAEWGLKGRLFQKIMPSKCMHEKSKTELLKFYAEIVVI